MNQPLHTLPAAWAPRPETDPADGRETRGALLRLVLAAMLTVAALAVATGLAP
jgi:hypothetical protein